MTDVRDDLLMAYVDGALDVHGRLWIEAQLAVNPQARCLALTFWRASMLVRVVYARALSRTGQLVMNPSQMASLRSDEALDPLEAAATTAEMKDRAP